MDTVQRFDRVADYILDCFAAGNTSVSKDDVIDDDGTVLGEEVFAVLWEIRRDRRVIGDDNKPFRALDTLAQAWGDGFALASGDDLTEDDETVSSVLSAYRAAPTPLPARGPAP